MAAAAAAHALPAPAPRCARHVLGTAPRYPPGAARAAELARARLQQRRRRRTVGLATDLHPCSAAGDAPAKKAKGAEGGAAGAAKKGGKGAKKATEDTPPEEAAAAAAAPRSGRVAAQGVRYTDMEASVDEALRRSKADMYVAPKEEAAAVSEAAALEQTHGSAGVRRIFDFKGAFAPRSPARMPCCCSDARSRALLPACADAAFCATTQ